MALEEASNAAVPALESFQNAAAVYGFGECSEGPHARPPATGARRQAAKNRASKKAGSNRKSK